MRSSAMASNQRQAGFTLIEVMVVAPIVLLTIAAFIGIIIALTGQVLVARADNTLAVKNQSALNIIEQDIRLSRSFLSTNTFTPISPQGSNDAMLPFQNVATGAQPVLILNVMATSNEQTIRDRKPIYKANTPFACGHANIAQNQIFYVNVVYFIKDSTLWRRTLAPPLYDVDSCNSSTIRQVPTCNASSSTCKARDMELVKGVNPGDFTIQYFSSGGSTAELTGAVATGATSAARQTVLDGASSVRVTLRNSDTVAGKTTSYTGALRASRLMQSPL